MNLRCIVVGLGVQGEKRRQHAGRDIVATVDPVNKAADYTSIEQVPLGDYDAALCCIPDDPKFKVLKYFAENQKHVLVEKPLSLGTIGNIQEIESIARSNDIIIYTAYNHRFEPHFIAMKNLIASKELGKIYSCRMFYGNGTARLVRESAWRDAGSGVIHDLGSHLLDTAAFWFGQKKFEEPGLDIALLSANRFENLAPDHAILRANSLDFNFECEMTMLAWRNHFTCDVFAEKGSAHIESLCKWGPTTFTKRIRVLPSGRPPETSQTLIQPDPTWALEYVEFKSMIANKETTDLSKDIWLSQILENLAQSATIS